MPASSPDLRYLWICALASVLLATTSIVAAARPATEAERGLHVAQVSPDHYTFENSAAGYRAENRQHRLTIGFGDGAVRLAPMGVAAAEDWTSEFRLVRYGHPGMMQAAEPTATRAAGPQLEVEHPGLVEWYVNDRRGLEQGFTFAASPPSGVDGDPLVLEMELCGSLDAHQEGASVWLSDRATGVSFRYAGLVAWDATGRYLPARMRLGNSLLALEVDVVGAIYPVTVDPTITEDAKLTASDGAADDWFGYAVALDADTAVIGAREDDDAGSGSGSAYVFIRSGTSWSQQAKLTASDAAAADAFGAAVAVDGDTAVVGAPQDDSSTGSVYVFVRSGTSWSEQAKLTASDAATFDQFGGSISIDGDTAVVGALGDASSAGSAYVFVRNGTSWSEQAKLTASDAAAFDHFGSSVAIAGDTAVAGAYDDDDAGFASGSAYVFVRSGTSWSQQAKLTASDAASLDEFGRSVAVAGETAVAGARGDEGNAGAAYVFVRSGTSWSEQAKLTASDAAAGDKLGWAVSIAGDTAVTGAPGEGGTGAAYVFVRSGSSWSEDVKLTASDAAFFDNVGAAVAIAGDIAVVGAYGAPDANGAAYVFHGVGVPPDTDGDGLSDTDETDTYLTDPGDADSDDDGLVDGYEVFEISTDPLDLDSDDDGLQDGTEVGEETGHPTDTDGGIFVPDTDPQSSTDPNAADSDSGGVPDGGEDFNFNGAVDLGECDPNVGADDGFCFPGTDLVVDFGPLGTWVYANDFVWTRIHTRGTDSVAVGDVDGSGVGDVVAGLASGPTKLGLWVYFNQAGWTRIHTLNPLKTVVGDLDASGHDDVIADFGPAVGTWAWMNNASWIRLHTQSPELLLTGQLDGIGGQDLVLSLGARGTWVLYNNTLWRRLHASAAVAGAIGNFDGGQKDDLAVTRQGSAGLWVYYNNISWVQRHARSPLSLAAGDLDGNGQAEIIADFGPGITLWGYFNHTSWIRLHSRSPISMVTADLDADGGDDLVVDFGPGVTLWRRYSNGDWSRLHDLSPQRMAAGEIFGGQ